MQCKHCGYVIRCHDQIRELFAKLINEEAHGVEVEPRLQPLSGVLTPGTTTDDEARLDFAGRDFWQPCEICRCKFVQSIRQITLKNHAGIPIQEAGRVEEREVQRPSDQSRTRYFHPGCFVNV